MLNLLVRLKEADVAFVLIGGWAAALHGCTLVTQDIDVCMDFSIDNLMRLQKAIGDLNPVHRMTPQKLKLNLTPKNCEPLKNLYLDTDWGPLDCLSQVTGLGDYAQVMQKSQEVVMDHYSFFILHIEALIQAKEALNRPQDQMAVNQLEKILKLKNN